MDAWEKAIERLFTFTQMCATAGLLNVVFRSVMPIGWAALLTVPWVVLALAYLMIPVARRHGKVIERFDPSGDLVMIVGLTMLALTFWITDLLAKTVSVVTQ